MDIDIKEARDYKEGFRAGQIDMLESQIKLINNMSKDNIEIYELKLLLEDYKKE